MSARSQIESLLAIITEAAYDVLAQYENHGGPPPTLDSTLPHPLDDSNNNIQLKKIITKLEGACGQLCATLSPPSHSVMNRAQEYGWACLRVAATQRFADELMPYPLGLHVNDLSKKVNVHPMKLACILRVLAAKHCFREVDKLHEFQILVSPDVFANNRLSVNITSNSSLGALIDLITEEGQKSAAFLSEYLVDPQFGPSLSMTEALFQYRNRDSSPPNITSYEWLQLKENQERRKVMMKAMGSMNAVIGSLSVLNAYPWDNVPRVCDVGSGMGSFARSLLETFPKVNVIQFDLPETIKVAKQIWKDDFADRNQFVEGDFFLNVPTKDCDVYYLRNILHNWTDEKALEILRSVRKAMGPSSRVLFHDHLLRHMDSSVTTKTDGLETAPAPMLPNYGAGNIRLYHQDFTMMLMYNAKERTAIEMINIGEKANLRVHQVFDLGEMCVIEFGVGEDAQVTNVQ